MGALFYRYTSLIAKSNEKYEDNKLANDALSLLGWLDWLPVRLWSLCLLVAGDFSNGFARFREQWLDTDSHAKYLDDLSLAAAGCELSSDSGERIAEDQMLRRKLLSLSDRAMWVALIFMLILVLL